MLGTTVAATMAIAPAQDAVAADVAPKAGSATQKQFIMNGWYFLQPNWKYVPFNSANPEHRNATKLYALGLDPKTNTYKPVKEVAKQWGTTPGVFATIKNIGTNVTNGASNLMKNTMWGVGNALSYIGNPTPQPMYIPRNTQIPPAVNTASSTPSSNPQATLDSLVQRARKGESLGKNGLRKARNDLASIKDRVVISKPDDDILNLWLFNKATKK